jgi:hypothetical protein
MGGEGITTSPHERLPWLCRSTREEEDGMCFRDNRLLTRVLSHSSSSLIKLITKRGSYARQAGIET